MNEEKPGEILERPREVLYVVQLTCASLALGFVSLIVKQPDFMKPALLAIGITAVIMGTLFSGFLLYMIWHGRNWARILYLILFFIGAPFAFPAIIMVFQKSLALSAISLIKLSLQIMAAVLLLQKPVRDWFKMIKLRKFMSYQLT